ncbi:MAG TPA: hypothetical protein DCO77_04095, partial [Nitrospiraceae bacterium]|nr:hypothetical protein [Nitrospiraceae bacterium]
MNLFFPKKRAKNTLSSLSAWICAHLRPILAFVLFFSIPAVSAAQDFTATALGDYGNVTVMEVAGSYDADLPDGTPNQLSRRVIAKEFYKTHKDEYDFLVIFTNFNFQMPYDGEAVAFYTHVKNDTLGIGKPAIDHTEAFGSNDKLQGTVDMGNVANLATDPFDPNFNVTLRTLTHELMHRWAASAKFRDIDGTDSSALLGKHGSHWSFLLDSQGSVLYGNRWQDNGDGTFTSLAPRREMDLYSPLELYLMGITDRSQVPPMLLIENPDVDHTRLPEAGVTINGTARTVTIDDIIAAMGERFPTPASSQKAFKSAFIFITSPGTFRGDEIYGIENIRNHGITRFSVLTDGKSIMEVASTQKEDIPVNPGVTPPTTTPRTVPPRLEDGVTWLVQAQRAEDGAWMDLSQTMERDTAVATLAVKSFPSAQQNYLGGIAWLKDAFSGNMDYLSRKIEALAGAGADVAPSIEELLSRQNADGGWGSEAHYTSNPLDTALAVRALTGAKHQDTAIISRAIDYLRSKQNPDNGWGSDDQGSTVQATSQVLSVFNSYRSAYQLEEQITSGIDMLVGRQNLNGDGGFGNSPSTVYDTAMAITTLRELGASTEITSRGAQYILDQQSENGSWYDSVYQTALAVSALLKATVEPDLSITSPDISFIPTTVTRLPVTITVTADVHNLGRTAATAKVFLYDGDPALGNRIGEQEAAFLGERATTVTFQAVVADGNTHYYYVVVDPDNSVKETSETNNQAVKVLYPEQTYDFAVTSLTVSPTAVEMFQNVTIRAEINNSGTTDGYAVQVRYYIDEPGAPFQIATRTLDLSSNGSVIDEFTWRANKAGADLPVTVVVDADNGYAGELSEDNNSATAALTVNIPVITNPNLEVSHNDLVITPNPVDEPASVSIALPVKNSGFSTPPENIQVNFYNGDPAQGGALLGGRTIQPLNQGESATVTFAWTDIQGSGDRLVYVKVDPDNVIPEVTEEDNSTFGTFHIRSLPDLVVSEHTISINPPAPSEEEDAVITVSIENAGEQTADDVLVTVFEGSTEIGSRTIASISGGSVAIASFTYPTSGKAGAHQITVSADPNGTVTEQHEDNNTVSKTFGVQNADLWLTEKYISPNGDGVQDSTQLFFRLDAPTTAVVHILNEQGDTVRILSSTGAVNTTGGSVIWDGLDNEGRVVGDGQYQATIVDGNGNAVHRVLIVVDNNRSPLLSAIGTPYLYRKNIGCNIPFYGQSWQWKNDESGFFVYGENINGQWYRQGLIDYSPDEQDWNVIDYYGWWTNSGFIGWSQDGSRFAVIRYSGSRTDGHDILVYDKQGDFLFNFNLGRPDRFSYKWSGDGATVAVAGIYDEYDYRLYINRTGYDNVVLTWGTQTERNTIKFDFAWSPDSSRLIYYDGNAEEIHVVNADGSNDTLLYSMSYPVDYLEWIDDERVLVSKQGHGTIVINTLDGTRTQISDLLLSSLSPDKTTMLMKEGPDTWVFVGIGGEVIDRFTLDTEFNDANVTRFYWSPDGKKTAWVQGDDLFIVGDERQNGIALHKSVPSIVAWLDGNNLSYITYTSPDSGEMQVYDTGANEYAVLQTFDDPSWSDSNGAVWLDFKISPLATYFSWRREFTNDNDCSFSYYLTRSLLNLTADFYVSKSDSSMILNGTAVDLNFEGWKLEYSSNGVDGWNPIVPFSDKPAIDEPIASWTPPVEGIFYVKLTAWDKAGNITETTKRVSSKKASNITSVYRTHDVFSPNGDDVKDTVELHYRALDAVHLDFTILDEQGNIVRTFTKD